MMFTKLTSMALSSTTRTAIPPVIPSLWKLSLPPLSIALIQGFFVLNVWFSLTFGVKESLVGNQVATPLVNPLG